MRLRVWRTINFEERTHLADLFGLPGSWVLRDLKHFGVGAEMRTRGRVRSPEQRG